MRNIPYEMWYQIWLVIGSTTESEPQRYQWGKSGEMNGYLWACSLCPFISLWSLPTEIALHFTVVLFLTLANVFILSLWCFVSTCCAGMHVMYDDKPLQLTQHYTGVKLRASPCCILFSLHCDVVGVHKKCKMHDWNPGVLSSQDPSHFNWWLEHFNGLNTQCQ